MKLVVRLLAMPAFALATACDLSQPATGMPLTDGCYYVGATPALRIQGSRGVFLIPGDVAEVEVEARRAEDIDTNGAVFTPGFHLQLRPMLRTVSPEDMPGPRMHLMMKPMATVPTILVHIEPLGMVDLARGPPC